LTQISLFDITPPPTPVSGEAFQLSPLDVLAFLPIGTIAKGGEKLTSGLFSAITKLFPKAAILPASKTVTQTAFTVGGRAAGSTFRQSATITPALISGTTVKATIPKTIPVFKAQPISKNLALATVTAGSVLGTTALLTQTEGGEKFTEEITDTAASITNFAQQNPLIIAGIVGLGIIMAVK
jgi:hypothetical protein